ncbi:hypothetical protein [Flavobacterium sp. ACN6]|uniref:hypothetical protein n=1 Tax=Flavobacterium sp. ACN6 TaxID=1920426 RepID=UPI001143FE05|nr:hypothetical protein [Flavobacterium sp. ACN6]PBJ10171.1 hypothetical protein BSF42_32400 [Flavobacterium sp. ACN6]
MKTLFKTKIVILFLITVFAFSCKKNGDANNVNSNEMKSDTMDMSVDTIAPAVDSSATLKSDENGKNGTTGATGEGSTGSGTEGSKQKGNQNVKTDSI